MSKKYLTFYLLAFAFIASTLAYTFKQVITTPKNNIPDILVANPEISLPYMEYRLEKSDEALWVGKTFDVYVSVPTTKFNDTFLNNKKFRALSAYVRTKNPGLEIVEFGIDRSVSGGVVAETFVKKEYGDSKDHRGFLVVSNPANPFTLESGQKLFRITYKITSLNNLRPENSIYFAFGDAFPSAVVWNDCASDEQRLGNCEEYSDVIKSEENWSEASVTLTKVFAEKPAENQFSSTGYLDLPKTNFVANGWACDNDVPSKSLDVELWLNGKRDDTTNLNRYLLGVYNASDERPDLNRPAEDIVMCSGTTNHGFGLTLDDIDVTSHVKDILANGEIHYIYAYAQDHNTSGQPIDNNYNLLNGTPQTYQHTIKAPLLGDINCDDKVTVTEDILAFLAIWLDGSNEYSCGTADVNADGTINAFDLLAIIDILFP